MKTNLKTPLSLYTSLSNQNLKKYIIESINLTIYLQVTWTFFDIFCCVVLCCFKNMNSIYNIYLWLFCENATCFRKINSACILLDK